MAIIDLLAILPSITLINDSFKFLRILRIVRILRMFKGLTIMTNVFIRERKALLSIIFFMCVYVLTVGLIMFTVEPDTFNNFLDALYWSTTALATIGYGDITPVSDFGKFIAIISSLVGIAVVAFPAGIVTGGYITQLQKARDKGSEYFALPVKHDKVYKGKPITKYKSAKSYFNANKKVKYYLTWLIIGVLISLATTLYVEYDPYSIIYFDEYGSILISVILEPCAGIFVCLINDIIYCVYSGSAFGILTFAVGAMYSVIFGIYFRRGRKITSSSIWMLFLVCIVFNTIYMLISYFMVYDERMINYARLYYPPERVDLIMNYFGISEELTLVALYFFGRFIYAIFCFISVLLVRSFLWGSKIDPMLKIPAKKRYKMKVYKRGKNEKSYIQDWLDQNTAEDEDIPEFQAAVKRGRESIAQTRKSIEEKRQSIEEMQQDVQEKIAEIQQRREEIAKHEAAIDVKKRAVRRAKRIQRIEESDSAISNIASAVMTTSEDYRTEGPGADTVGQTDSFKPIESNENTGEIPPVEPKHQAKDSE